jgi:hypothetical protein
MAVNGKTLETIGLPTNDAAVQVALLEPYTVEFELTGSSAMLFHRWSDDAVKEKAEAAKGSKAKKTDDVESYVYRNAKKFICLPGEYVRQSVVNAAKFRQDPRSPRKSAMDLYKAGVVSLTELASLGSKDWDYLDRRRVAVQRNGITRQRPAFNPGWKAKFQFMVTLPEYISEQMLLDVLTLAGRTVGVADYRPTFGRFGVTSFKRL